jgi:cell wall integrity and stress response component
MRLSSLVVIGKVLSFLSLFDIVLADEVALKAFTHQGCFESSEPLEDEGSQEFQSLGACQKQCVELGKAVMGLAKGSHCWCGDFVPAADSKVPDSKCSSPCVGYDIENCSQNPSIICTGSR